MTAPQPKAPRREDVRRIVVLLAEPVVAVVFAMLIGGVLIFLFSGLLPDHSPFDAGLPFAAYGALLSGAVGTPWTGDLDAIIDTLVYSTPLVLAGLGVAIGFKAGLFNIGGRGQFLIGATGAMAAAQLIGTHTSSWIAVPAALLAGALIGAAAGFVPGFLKATSGAHEVVTTIMLNYVLVFTVNWAIKGPLTLPRAPQPMTQDVTALNASLPVLFGPPGHTFHVGILLAFVAVPLMWFLLYRTTLGFEIRAAGANPDAARYGGMHTRFLIVLTMTIAGLMCGLAGAVTLLGVVHQMPLGYDTTIGFDAITVALLGRSNPWGVGIAGLLLGGMRAGAQAMQIQAGVPTELVDTLQAIILLFLVVNILRRFMARRRAAGPLAPEFASISGVAVVPTEAAQ
jgi:general nucleoside transport system permease protein